MLLRGVDMKEHDEALEKHPKYAKNGRACVCERGEKKIEGRPERERERGERNWYDILVEVCQPFRCLSILSNMLSSNKLYS